MMKARDGAIRTSIQGQGGSAVAAAGERDVGRRGAGDPSMSFSLELTGHRALVTSGPKGVGAAAAAVLCNAGVKVMTSARSVAYIVRGECVLRYPLPR